jgi:hypothetical protein
LPDTESPPRKQRLSLLWLYWLSAITLLNVAADRFRMVFVFSSMFNECFF